MSQAVHEKTEHGCAIVLGTYGLLVRGPSGSGKSILCRLLIDRWHQNHRHASWVADDRVILTASGTKVAVKPAPQLAGLHEQCFAGIQNETYSSKAIVDYVIELKNKNEMDRMPDPQSISLLAGCLPLPVLQAPKSEPDMALSLIATVLTDKSL